MEIAVFNRWPAEGIKVLDKGLERYLSLEAKFLPKSGGRYAKAKFHKSGILFMERLVNKIMVVGHKGKKHFISSGHQTGKKEKLLGKTIKVLGIIEHKTKTNPIEVVVRAIENAAPREEIITIEYGGARYPKAVDVSPQRRIDLALRFITQGAYQKSFNKKIKIEEALADEIINAYHCSARSNAIAKKRDLERQAASSK